MLVKSCCFISHTPVAEKIKGVKELCLASCMQASYDRFLHN